jgi:hypothetical protein
VQNCALYNVQRDFCKNPQRLCLPFCFRLSIFVCLFRKVDNSCFNFYHSSGLSTSRKRHSMMNIVLGRRVRGRASTGGNAGRNLFPSCAGCAFGLGRKRAGQDYSSGRWSKSGALSQNPG